MVLVQIATRCKRRMDKSNCTRSVFVVWSSLVVCSRVNTARCLLFCSEEIALPYCVVLQYIVACKALLVCHIMRRKLRAVACAWHEHTRHRFGWPGLALLCRQSYRHHLVIVTLIFCIRGVGCRVRRLREARLARPAPFTCSMYCPVGCRAQSLSR